MSTREEGIIKKLMREHGMVLERQKKHRVYRHPDGRSLAMSKSPRGSYAEHQALRELEKFLGLKGIRTHRSTKPGERRPPKKKGSLPLALEPISAKAGKSLAEQLRGLS